MAVTVSASSFSHSWASTREEATEEESRCSEGQYRPAGKRVGRHGPAGLPRPVAVGGALGLGAGEPRKPLLPDAEGAPPTPRKIAVVPHGPSVGAAQGADGQAVSLPALGATTSHWGVGGDRSGDRRPAMQGTQAHSWYPPLDGSLNAPAIPGTSDTLSFVTRTGRGQLARDEVCGPSRLRQPRGPAARGAGLRHGACSGPAGALGPPGQRERPHSGTRVPLRLPEDLGR